MEVQWFFVFVTVCIGFAVKALLSLIHYVKTRKDPKLPPGPNPIFSIGQLRWLPKRAELSPALRRLRSIYGDIVTLQLGSRKGIFITSADLAYRALIQQGATFADRPPAPETTRFFSSNLHTVNAAGYGPVWRSFRRNYTSGILHPTRIRSFSPARKWVLEDLKKKFMIDSQNFQKPVSVKEDFLFTMFKLFVFMCFGQRFDEEHVKEIRQVHRDIVLNFGKFNILNFFPKLSKIFLRNKWAQLYKLHENLGNVVLPLIRARERMLDNVTSGLGNKKENESFEIGTAFVDTLLEMIIPEDGGRKLNDNDMLSLCAEFLNGGTDTTSTVLLWIMAEIVRNQEIQEKIYQEVKSVVDDDAEIVEEQDLKKMPYLRAAVLEALRRHPPAHFVVPHAVTEDTVLAGYLIPKDAMVNFSVAEIGLDPKVWEDPLEFKPERFLAMRTEGAGDNEEEDVFDITGTKGIKMIPFSAGRRICPGLDLAMLHLQYFTANLVREFKWTTREGDEVDLSEVDELTVVMKNPLVAVITPRKKTSVTV